MSDSRTTLDSPFARQTPNERQANAEAFVRGCFSDFKQPVTEEIVRTQAAKIVRSMCQTLGVKRD